MYIYSIGKSFFFSQILHLRRLQQDSLSNIRDKDSELKALKEEHKKKENQVLFCY